MMPPGVVRFSGGRHGFLPLMWAVVIAAAIPGCSPAPPPMQPHSIAKSRRTVEPAFVPSPLPTQKVTLPNGLTIVTLEDHSAPVTSVQVWVRTGSIHESSQMGAGLSHILEHMLFKGTEKRKVADIARQVEAYGGDINAYTSWDRTVYHIDIPAEGGKVGTAQGTEMAIDILADAMMNSTLPMDEYKREQEVILREMAMRMDSPDRQASELFFATVYQAHPCRHPVIGYTEVYKKLSREDVIAYYKARYVPNNLIFVVAGDIDTAKVRKQITALMGAWDRRALPPVFIPDEPSQISARVAVEESHTAAEQARLHLGYPTCDFRNPDAPALEILAAVAGQGMSSRLYQHLREKKQLVHEVDAWSHMPGWRGVFGASAICDPDKAEAARDAILADLGRFKTTLITADELSKALKMARSGHLGARKTMGGLAGTLGSDELVTGDLQFSDKYLAALERVTAEDVQRVARTYFRPETLNVAILQPKGKLKTATVVASKTEQHAIEKIKLPNGLTLLLKEDHRLPFVELRLVMKSGLLFEESKNNGISQLTAKLLLKGTKNRKATEIVQQIESVGGSIAPYSGSNSMGLSIEVMNSDLPLALDIMTDIIRNSTFADAEIRREQEAQIAEIRQERERPMNVAMINARARLFGAHPYSMPNLGTESKVAALTRNEIVGFWERVAAPSNMVLSIFGDLRPDQARELARKTMGQMVDRPLQPPETTAAAFGKADRVQEKQDKDQAVVVIVFPGIDIKNPDRPGLELMSAALSGMGSRLFLRLRDQLALCYYVGVNEMIGLDPGFIYFYIGTKPASVATAEKEIFAEIEKIRTAGITAEELDRARNGILGARKMQKQSLGDLAMASALDELYGLGYDYAEKLEAAYGAVTVAEVHAIARKYLGRPPVVSIVKP